MNFFDAIMFPIRIVIEAILVFWHSIFTFFGMNPDSGATWVLSIVGLVIIVRAALIPVFIKQIKSSRRMMEIQPKIKKIQDKYKGKKDQFSREAMTKEITALYKKEKANPLSSCLPLLIQMPIFFGLFSVIQNASNNKTGIGLMSEELSRSFAEATIFGAPLRMSFSQAIEVQNYSVMIIAAILVVLMVSSQFYTQLQLTSKNVSEETKNSPMYKQQKILLYIIPFMFVFSGIAFPLSLNIYWFTSNIWTSVQQFIVIRSMPNPGTEAYKIRQERLIKKGKIFQINNSNESIKDGNSIKQQRVQPVSKKRFKKGKK